MVSHTNLELQVDEMLLGWILSKKRTQTPKLRRGKFRARKESRVIFQNISLKHKN
jgi:hypothetical protein